MQTQFKTESTDQVFNEANSLLNSGALNFSIVAGGGRTAVAIKSIDVREATQSDDYDGYTVDTEGEMRKSPGSQFVGIFANPTNGNGAVYVETGHEINSTLVIIIHETLHLDSEINFRKKEIANNGLSQLSETTRKNIDGLIEHKLRGVSP